MSSASLALLTLLVAAACWTRDPRPVQAVRPNPRRSWSVGVRPGLSGLFDRIEALRGPRWREPIGVTDGYLREWRMTHPGPEVPVDCRRSSFRPDDPARPIATCDLAPVVRVVRSRTAALRACWPRRRHPGRAASITVRWVIGLDGRVQGASLPVAALDDLRVTGCVLDVVRGVRFAPREDGPCIVQWPIAASSGER